VIELINNGQDDGRSPPLREFGSCSRARIHSPRPLNPICPPNPVALFILGCIVATIIYTIVIVAFGQWPDFPPLVTVAIEPALIAPKTISTL
jgi:hypothetical protein